MNNGFSVEGVAHTSVTGMSHNSSLAALALTGKEKDPHPTMNRRQEDGLEKCQPAVDALKTVGLVEFLALDPRPTFVVDLDIADRTGCLLQPVYSNHALQSTVDGDLMSLVSGKENMESPGAWSVRPYSKFRKWMFNRKKDPKSKAFTYSGLRWTKVIIKGRWSVISALEFDRRSSIPDIVTTEFSPSPSRAATPGSRTPKEGTHSRRPSNVRTRSHDDIHILQQSSGWAQVPEEAISRLSRLSHIQSAGREGLADFGNGFDWTVDPPSGKMTEWIKFARSIDWSMTPLGPRHSWSPQLRLMANLIMRDTKPAVLFWGSEVVMIYNEPYIELIGDLHPFSMGKSAAVALKDYWDHFTPFTARNILVGEAVQEHNLPVFLMRNGVLEETYYSFSMIPILGDHGTVAGHYEPVTETTKHVVSQRRLETLLLLSEETSRARTLDSFWQLVLGALSHNDKDVPFALLYAMEDEDSSDTMSMSTNSSSAAKQCVLKGSLGVPDGHPAAPHRLDFLAGTDGFVPFFREAMKSRGPTVLDFEGETVPKGMLDGIQWRGFGHPCQYGVICPITPTTTKNVLGFLVVGINPRRPYDEDYQKFMCVTSRLLATCGASVVLHEEDIRQREKMITQAELIKANLTEQLIVSQKEAERNEKKFQRFAERADVGIFIVGSDGRFTYRNKAWFNVAQLSEDLIDFRETWRELCLPEDQGRCEKHFAKLMTEKVQVVMELRLKRSWEPPHDIPDVGEDHWHHSMWILISAFPELSDSGEVQEIVGAVTDISRLKWGEGLQKQRTDDALRSKRQLESFIDTTSHEMRNPLSAIVQCADSIIESHRHKINSNQELAPTYLQLLKDGVEAAQTIAQCSQHMKCIVDDVLTMSKLDSGLLVMTPVDAQPDSIGRHAVKMFEAEAKAADISLRFRIEPSYHNIVGADFISLDPTRLLQILINLVTNAIKFTRLEATRKITVSVGAALARPVCYFNERDSSLQNAAAEEAPSLLADWAQDPAQNLFIKYSVEDTGRGLSEDEKDLLFARFSQASPRTHISYGGSGLGLFISRRLSEMHGGAIWFSSESKHGSTFSFYIKARRSTDVQDGLEGTTQLIPDLMTPLAAESPLSESPPCRNASGAGSFQEHEKGDERKGRPKPFRRPSMQRRLSIIPPTPVHILLVEDNLINQRVLANQLRSKGWEVSVANHGAEALDFLRRTKFCAHMQNTMSSTPSPTSTICSLATTANDTAKSSFDSSRAEPPINLDLILMDWEMPVMDGLTAVREIRRLQREGTVKGHVPVIAVTANVRGEQINTAMEAGMDDVVSKPFRVPELAKKMTELVCKMGGHG
ncbi:hypothetical protein BKA81DRAFT_379022 [Phyllosticta paracitricarpa]|uniref:Aerobic respiration control sensor protein-like protein arcB n=1 Tax=Phyllosticta paracitricarpa TaxID=2016321 RepID=A0ABR1NCP8_9PEZI